MIGLLMMLVSQAVDPSGLETGNSLYALCTGSAFEKAECKYYVSGVADLQSEGQSVGNPKLVCISNGVTRLQITDVVTAYLRDHPEVRHYAAGELTVIALMHAFPCHKGG